MATNKFYQFHDTSKKTLYYNDTQVDTSWQEVSYLKLKYSSGWQAIDKVLPYKAGLKIHLNDVYVSNLDYWNINVEANFSGFIVDRAGMELLGYHSGFGAQCKVIMPTNYEVLKYTADMGQLPLSQPEFKAYYSDFIPDLTYGNGVNVDAPYATKIAYKLNKDDVITIELPLMENLRIVGTNPKSKVIIKCPKLNTLSVSGSIGELVLDKTSGRLSLTANSPTLKSINTGKTILTTIKLSKCPALTSFAGTFDGTDLSSAFSNCSQLETITLNLLRPVTNWNSTFAYCSSLINIYIVNPTATGSGSSTFYQCTSLVGGKGTAYNSSYTDYKYAKNDNSTPGYFKAIGDPAFTAKVYKNDKPEFHMIYDLYTAKIFNCTYVQDDKRYTLDHWLVWNGTQWENKGEDLALKLLDVKTNPEVIPTLRLATSSDATFDVSLESFPINSGTVVGAGTYKVGDRVTITATAAKGYAFKQWEEYEGGQWTLTSTEREYKFTIGRDRRFRAVFVKLTPENTCVLTLKSDGNGKVEGAGIYLKGSKATIKAIPNSEYTFKQWTNKGSTFSDKAILTFTIITDTELVAEFAYNPYNPSKPGGGDGNHDDTSDPIDKDDVSNLINAGFGRVATIYTPTKEQFDDFFNYLYGSNFENVIADLATRLNTLGGKPLDYVLNCYILPVDITPKDPADIKTKPFNLGWYDIKTLDMNYSEHRFMDYGCGEIEIKPYWGNALDYKSTIQIYLPYIGYKSLDCAEVMGHKVGVKYTIDFMTGDCVAKVLIDRSIHYQFNGNLAYKLPLSSSNFTDLLEASLSIGTNMAIGAATGTITGGASLATSVAQGATQMMNVGGNVSRAGNLPSNTGVLSVQTPYIIINRPRLSVPENYAHYHGFPSNITCQLKTLQGYTEVSDIHLENITATLTELQEIETLLKQGVII